MPEYNFTFNWARITTLGKVQNVLMPIVGAPSQAQVTQAVADYIEAHPGSLSPLSAATKAALLQIAEKVAYIDEHGQDYYDALDAALNAVALLQITAVYTQTGTVYDTDSLNSLKDDLVVTAYYDNGSTGNVTSGCVLSGTLTQGTSTITATYGGKTDTFNVTVTHATVPSGYIAYDYLYSTSGSDSDYVDTGLTYSPSWSTLNLEFEAENNNSSSASDAVIGANNANSSNTSNMLWYARQSKGGYSAFNLGVAKQLNTIPADTRAVIKYFFVDGGESYMQWNDTTVAVATINKSSITANGKSLILCGGRTLSGSNPKYGMWKSKLGYVKFTDPTTGDLVYNFIPAYGETEGKYGFYETVHGVFYPENSTHMLGGYWE